MFGRNKIDLGMVVPTSKMSLKASCINACGNDIEKASRLYDFFAKDIASLPDFDIPKPTAYQQVKAVAGEVFGWLDSNRDKLAEAYSFIRSARQGRPVENPGDGGTPPADVAPIPEEA